MKNPTPDDVRRFEAAFAQAWYSKHGSEAAQAFMLDVEFTDSRGDRRGLCCAVSAGQSVQSVEADMREAFGLGPMSDGCLAEGTLLVGPFGPFEVTRIDHGRGKYGSLTARYAGANQGVADVEVSFVGTSCELPKGWHVVERRPDTFKQWRKPASVSAERLGQIVGVCLNDPTPDGSVEVLLGGKPYEVTMEAEFSTSAPVIPAEEMEKLMKAIAGAVGSVGPVGASRPTRKVQVGDVWRPNGADCVAEWVKETTITKLHMGQSQPYADALGDDGETWAMSLTRDGYPESAGWTLVRPASANPTEAPQVKVGQRYATPQGAIAVVAIDTADDVVYYSTLDGRRLSRDLEVFNMHVANGTWTLIAEPEPPKPAVGQVWRPVVSHVPHRGFSKEFVELHGDCTVLSREPSVQGWLVQSKSGERRMMDSAVAGGHWQFVSHGTAPREPESFEEAVAMHDADKAAGKLDRREPVAPAKPKPRCGQTWRCRADWPERDKVGLTYELFDTSPDFDGHKMFRVRFSDGRKATWKATGIAGDEFVSGPTTPETPREAYERVVRLEAADVPEGLSAGEWLGRILNATAFEDVPKAYRSSADDVRVIANQLRAKHLTRWQAWRGDASRGVR